MSARNRDVATAVGTLVLGVAVYLATLSFPAATAEYFTSGPALAPRIIAVVLGSLSLWLLAAALLRPAAPAAGSAARHEWRETWIIGLLLVAYALSLKWIGFAAATPVFTLVVSRRLGAGRRAAAAMALGLTAAAYIAFRVLLAVPLPSGWLFGGFR